VFDEVGAQLVVEPKVVSLFEQIDVVVRQQGEARQDLAFLVHKTSLDSLCGGRHPTGRPEQRIKNQKQYIP
jgi:gamma-glutamyl:cysteine ligase YbdK (ATP-grasp superfamily)